MKTPQPPRDTSASKEDPPPVPMTGKATGFSSLSTQQKILFAVACAGAGAITTLLLVGIGLYLFFGRHDDNEKGTVHVEKKGTYAPVPNATVKPTEVAVVPPTAPAPANTELPPAISPSSNPSPSPSTEVAPTPEIPALPARSNEPSVLGLAGSVGRLSTPTALPPGMLAFLRGLDQLGAYRPLDAVASFGQAIAANEENSDYYTARGGTYVVAEKMDQALPDLQRAMKLNPQNVLASRLTRLAYLMMGDQLKASKFYGHGSTKTADFLITEVGTGYGARALAKQYNYPLGPHDQQRYAAALQKLPTVASLVASSFQTGDEKSADALFALGVEQLAAKDFAAARRSFDLVLANSPHDWSSRYYHARSVLENGDPELARAELTFLLCWNRFLPEAYAARAMAAARQHDLRRAEADLKTLRTLDAAQTPEVEAAIAVAKAQPVPGATKNEETLWEELLASSKGREPFDTLAGAALELRRHVDARRLRWDETYQDRLRELCEASRADAKSADRRADVADFLRDHNKVRGLQVEPNGATHFFRQQTPETANGEIELAFTLVNEGLGLDPRHARSWALRSAILLHTYHKLEEADQAARAAVRFDPKLIAGYMALSDCEKESAMRLREQAAAYRTPKTIYRTVRVLDRDGNFVRNDSEPVSIPPSAEDLAKAAACDRQAAEHERQEQAALQNALASAKGTKDEPFYQALLVFMKKDYANARPWLEKAVKDNPTDPKMRHALASCLSSLGLEEEYLEEFARAINLQKTTGEVWLKVAWNKLDRNAFEAARKALLRARELDPSDARILAYWGIMAEFGTKDNGEALAAYRASLAQEEARARASQTTYLPAGAKDQVLSPEDLGLSMLVRMKAARLVFTSSAKDAAEAYLATSGNEPRMSEWNLSKVVYSAMLPYPDRDGQTQPQPPPLVAVLKNNRILCGQALLNAGRDAEAAAQFAAAENFAARLPAGGTAYLEFELEPQYYPFRVSSMPIYVKALNARALVKQGKREEARLELQKVRYYLANRTQEQREMRDDPIPALYAQIAPAVGLQ